jgi:hypothetical protein
MKKTLFLVSAQMQTGKDEFGKRLATWANGQTVAYASPVKEVAIAMLGMPPSVAYGGEKERRAWKRYGKDAREWLQWIGTELGRSQVFQTVWIHRLIERISASCVGAFVVTDARFGNELDFPYDNPAELLALFNEGHVSTFHESGYHVVKIRLRRPGAENKDAHASEAEQLGIPDEHFDEVIVNDGALKDLDNHAKRIANKYIR